MYKSFSYRLYPDELQKVHLAKTFGSVRFVYNRLLEMKIKAYQRRRQVIPYFECTKRIRSILKKAYPWLYDVNAQSLQMAARNLDTAFCNFFRNSNTGYPKFKKLTNRQSVQYPQGCKVDYQKQRIYLQKTGWVPCVLHRKFKGILKTVTVVKESSGKYYASILVDTGEQYPQIALPIERKNAIGIDLGITTLAVCSNGMEFKNNKYLLKTEEKLIKIQRSLSRKQKGSMNRKKVQRKLAIVHEKIQNQRHDAIEKATAIITDDNQIGTICMEDLDVSGMLKDKNLSKSVSDASFSFFRIRMEQKCKEKGKNFIIAPRFFASSKICNSCGYVNSNLTLGDRIWICPQCRTKLDRDRNASNNLRDWIPVDGGKFTPVEMNRVDEYSKESKEPSISEAGIVLGNLAKEASCV